MVEGACLENRCAGDRTGGSNPSLTAVSIDFQSIVQFTHKLTHAIRKVVRNFFYYILYYFAAGHRHLSSTFLVAAGWPPLADASS